ncbi:TRAP transporter substrate-binding protein DctP [Jeotgalicoccus psychrophilus]|uniref:TRAP transporter substrate-binding protein DctP n=1 Tax=Jeotgalicoccus psychrophilus TaxID=157228 RepID=UPI0003F75BCA|nr:TRAP transporter substrate-binding protein DctP [Jeotgalicoccus psychrophilus]
MPDENGEVTWKLNHIRPSGTRTDISAKQFSKDIFEGTDGRVDIDVYNNSQLGDYQLVQESVSLGEVEMQLATLGTNVDRTLQVAITPSLVSNYEEARELYNSEDGVLYKYFKEQLAEQNIKLLAVYPQYFGSIFLADEANDPKNPDSNKNIKVRVPAMKAFEEYGETLGFVVTPLASSEMFTAIQTGIVDGAIGGGTELYYNEFGELGQQILPVNTHFEAHYLTVNEEAFDALAEEDQNTILEFAEQFEEDAFIQAEEEQEKYNQLITEEHGVEVVEFTDEELQAYADKVREEVWPKLEDEYGDILDEIKKELE